MTKISVVQVFFLVHLYCCTSSFSLHLSLQKQFSCTHMLLHNQYLIHVYRCTSRFPIITIAFLAVFLYTCVVCTSRFLLHVYRCTSSFPLQLSLYKQFPCTLVSLVYVFRCTRSFLLYILFQTFVIKKMQFSNTFDSLFKQFSRISVYQLIIASFTRRKLTRRKIIVKI